MAEPNDLLAAQRALLGALRPGADSAEAAPWFAGEAELVARRLAVYRGNVVAAATAALRAAYPVIAQIVGDDYFAGLAREHLRAHPSTSGDLADHGAAFSAFLAQFEPARELPYLSDLARLEWAVHRAAGAADAPALDLAALGRVPPEQHGHLRLRPAPGLAVVASRHPVARLWAIHQPSHGGPLSVDWQQAETALVARAGWRVDVQAITAGTAAFVAALIDGARLEAAFAQALQADPAFEPATTLGRAIAAAWVTDFTLSDKDPS